MVEVSLSELARRLGRAKSGLHKLAAAGQIPKLPSGKFDVDAVVAALGRNLDPARKAVHQTVHRSLDGEQPPVNDPTPANRSPKPVAVRTEGDAKAAIALIARVLRDEGVASDGTIDFNAARTADTILKVQERELKIAQRRKELVPLARVKEHVEKAFIGLRQAIQRMPSRHVPEMAAALGCDPGALDVALSKAIAAELNELSAPVVRA